MKKLLTLIFLISFVCITKSRATAINTADSVYASGGNCNITVQFFKANRATAFIEGKKRTGTIFKDGKPASGQEQYYYFSANGKKVFIFLFSEGQMIILNQQYQYDCESAKGITLNRIIKKPAGDVKPVSIKSEGSLPYSKQHLPDKALYQILTAKIKGADEFLCSEKNLRYLPLPPYQEVKVLLVPMDCGDFTYRYYLLTILNNKVVASMYVEGQWQEPGDDSYKEKTRFGIDKGYKITVITEAHENGKTSVKSKNNYQLLSTGALKKL